MILGPRIPMYDAGTDHVGVLPTRQTMLAPSFLRSVVRCPESRMKGTSCIVLKTACWAGLHMDDNFNELIQFRCGHFQIQRWKHYVTVPLLGALP